MAKASKIISGVAALAVVAGGAVGLWLWKPWASKDSGGIKYETVAVAKGNISAQVTASGTLAARNTVQIGAQVSGRVVELAVDFNDKVTKGQVIAKLDDSVLRAQVAQSQANVDAALANQSKINVSIEDAQRTYERQQKLFEGNLTARAELDAAEIALRTAKATATAQRATISQASAALAQAKLNLSYAIITSPVDGVVISRSVDVGQTVAASLQAPVLYTIAEDLSRMQIDTSVAEADVGRLKDGMKATFTVDAFPGRTFDAVVRQVRNAPTTVSGVVTYDAVIDVDNSDRSLRPGMTANVTFVLEEVKDAIQIPNAALRFKPAREVQQALFKASGREMPQRGSGGGMGGGAGGPPSGPPGEVPPGQMGARGGSNGGANRDPDRRMLWKLVNGKPEPVRVKVGMTDGSKTQLVEGELQPGDLLITEVTGIAKQTRKLPGAF